MEWVRALGKWALESGYANVIPKYGLLSIPMSCKWERKVSVRDSIPGKVRSLLTNLVSSYDWRDTQFQSCHQEHSCTVECQLLEVKDSIEPHSLLTLIRACQICPIEVLNTHTEKRVTLWSTRKECDLGLSEVKGLPGMLRLPTQLDRGKAWQRNS